MRYKLILVLSILLLAGSVFSVGTNDKLLDNNLDDGLVVTPYLTAVFANIATDTSDYAPGDSVIISGGGFWAGESVAIDISNIYNPGFGDNDEPWYVIADALGQIETFWIVPPDGVDQTYLVTADGQSSGIHSEAIFTDANTKLKLAVMPFDTTCAGTDIDVCGYVSENCGGGVFAPLPNRPILFFLNSGNCGNDVGVNADDTVWTDENGLACATLTAPGTSGTYTIRIKFVGEDKPGPSDPPNSACDPSLRTKLSASNECEEFTVVPINSGNSPSVTLNGLTGDTTVVLCGSGEICLPVLIEDNECDIDTVYSNLGNYSGNQSIFDQVSRLSQLGGTATQVGGGAPGTILTTASDFVGPLNALSGVSVTLPNFEFISFVSDYGSFPSGIGSAQSADQLVGSPTDLTFTLSGAGGPDGGLGDGSVDFVAGNYVGLRLTSCITMCDGAPVDLVLFTGSSASGEAKFLFKKGGYPVYVINQTITGGSAGSAMGGVTVDLPDGCEFNEIEITCLSGSFDIDAVAARILPSASASDICFTADTSGVYTVIVTAMDKCWNYGADTAYVTVSMGNAPVADAGNDFSQNLCSLAEVCFGVSFSDIDNDLVLTELVSGIGTLAGGQICFTPTSTGDYSFIIHAVDSCGAEDYDTVVVSIDINNAPVAVQPDSVVQFLCETTQICNMLSASDPDSDSLTWTHISGVGSISSVGNFCFTPTATGIYEAVAAVSDPCGLADTVSLFYYIVLNSAPIAVDPPSPIDRFLCLSEEICYQFSANDANGGNLNWSMLAGSDGSITANGLWCFTPPANGSYSISAVVTDSCGLADTTSKTINITINDAPQITLGADTAYALCLSEQICLDYTVSDNQGLSGLTEVMLAGYYTLDTAANQICFVPSSAGTYQFIMSVSDSCGATSEDTINVTVTLGESASITCLTDTIIVNICDDDTVCQMINVSPSSATVTSTLGTYANSELCFFADSSGIYTATMIADEACGADTCEIVFNVIIGTAAQISCPSPQNIFICESDSICIPIGVNGSGVSVTVSPIGIYHSGNICFVADTSGHYEISVFAITDCGADSCVVVADIIINSTPVAVDPPAVIDTFLCVDQSVCYQFTANDVDGSALTWSKLSGVGTVSSGGQFCFTSSGVGSYAVSAVVTDSCGASDTVSVSYNVTLNSAPLITIANDTTVFLCLSNSVCVPYLTSDAENNIAGIDLLVGNGVVDTMNSNICFYPTTVGTYQFVARVTDDCGLVSIDTVNITVNFNNAPTVDAGVDQNLFLCTPTEICQTVTGIDGDGNLVLLEMTEGVGTFINGELCFTPDTNFCYEFVFRAVDDCGLEGVDTLIICVDLNNAPTADAGVDQTIFQCTPAEICLPASCSDIDGNLASCNLLTSVGSYNGSSICFTPDTSGLYSFILQATDDCGLTGSDTVLVDVTLNTAPVCNVPADTIISQCTLTSVCLPLSGSDVDNNLDYCQIISGPGTISGGNWCYTPTASQVVTVIVECVDSCSATCQSTFTIEFKINQAPVIVLENTSDFFLCDPAQLCVGYTISDPNDPQNKTVTLVSAFGTLDEPNNQVCFTPDSSGVYTFIVNVTDDCGASSADTALVTVTLNSAPIISLDANQTIELCQSQEVCVNASVSDIDNNLTSVDFSGSGTYDGSTICFTPVSSDDYQFILVGTDACGAMAVDTITITIILNNLPTVQFDTVDDTLLCTPTSLCVGYSVADADGLLGITEQMISGYGTIDTLNNKICFTPTTSGAYQFIVEVTDSCGALALDTVTKQVDFGESASISCPTNTIDINLCAADVVCQMIDIQPSSAVVTPSFGTYTNGELCFQADTSGIYSITIIADETCGSDTCVVVFNVTIGTGATISCPSAQSLFICQPDSICIPVGINGAAVSVSVSPIGSYHSGNICFPADTSGHYEINIVATAACGADSCVVVVDVVINEAPVAVDPPTPVDTFICNSDEICYQFTAADVNGGTLVWSRQSGDGTVSADGLWCFNASTMTSYYVNALVTDSCGATDLVNLVYNVGVNSAPIVTFVNDTTAQLCVGEELCYGYMVSDTNLNVISETLLTGIGVIDTVDNKVCFTPDTSGTYLFVVQATDDCGLSDVDSLYVTIAFNNAPVANAGADNSFFLCDNLEICIPASCSDIDGNLASCDLLTAVGTYNGSTICFTPDTAGIYTFILRAVDECGLADEDIVQITVVLNSPPTCNLPGPQTFYQCTPEQVSLPIITDDSDGNFDHSEILAGPGSIIGTNWVYTPTTSESLLIKIMSLDSCGAACIDSMYVTITINTPPIVSAGEDFTQFLCSPIEICFPITYSNITIENPSETVELISSTGTLDLNSNEICFTPDTTANKTYSFVLRAEDTCGEEDFDTVLVNVIFNNPPELNIPPSFVIYLDDPGEVCFDVSSSDVDSNLANVSVSSPGDYNESSDQVCFFAESSGEYCFVVTATDGCGLVTTKNICITIQIDECFLLQIDKTHSTIQGQYETVNIYFDGSVKEIGGFDISIGYDQSALTVGDVRPGELFTNCGWEYFTYRFGPDGNCATGCPSGVLRIIGIAETNNGGYHPDCFLTSVFGDLIQIDFFVSNDRTLECQYAPINFFWFDCGDNTLSSRLGDTLWMSRDVFGYEGNIMTDNSYGFPGYYGADDDCMVGGGEPGKMPIRCVDFTNGGIDIVCADSIDAVGDINLNEISYEIADAVLYSNYFVYGLSVFTVNLEGQIAASDVNKDGLTLSVADLVYLIRVIVGDASSYAKLSPIDMPEAQFTIQNGELVITETDDKIGAVSLLIEGNAKPTLIGDAVNMKMQYNFDGEFTRVIIYSLDGKDNLSEGQLLKLNGNSKITEIDIGSQTGYVMLAKLNNLPDKYELMQNYPNPFNPTTKINFGLPTTADWELVIYNVLGQVIETFEDNSEAGYIEIEWDASKYASGVYFYRLRAGEFSDTKKMVLLK